MRLELDQNASSVAQLERSAVVASSAPTMSHFDEVLSNGISAAQSGHRAQARILLQYAVELDPKSEAGWLWLASISEYPEELLIFLDRVLEINSKNSRAIEWKSATKQLMAKTFVQRGIEAANDERNDEAMSCFDTALSYDEQNQLAWFWKDSLFKKAANGDEHSAQAEESAPAASEVEEPAAVESDGHRSTYEAAEAALAAGDRDGALRLVNRAIEENTESETAWSLRSHLVDDFDEKRYSLERVVQINPDNFTARAALETLLAMVETVAPNPYADPAAVTEVFSSSPFDSVAEPVPVEVQENSPTGDLEIPESVVQHNPFDAGDHYEMPGDAWAPDASVDNTDEPYADSHSVSADDYPTIVVPFDEDDGPLYVADTHDAEDLPIAPPTGSAEINNTFNSPAQPEFSTVHEVQDVSASSYPEEASIQHNAFNTAAEPEGSSWNEDPVDSTYADDKPADAWVVEDTGAYTVEDMAANTAQTILVVDDSPVVRKLIAGKLEESGYNVLAAGSGVEALAIISNARPDLILLDIAMPKMDGYQVCEKIRKSESTRNIPVVMISGKDGYFDEDRGQKAGTSSFISKPFGPETLMKALDTYLPSPAAD